MHRRARRRRARAARGNVGGRKASASQSVTALQRQRMVGTDYGTLAAGRTVTTARRCAGAGKPHGVYDRLSDQTINGGRGVWRWRWRRQPGIGKRQRQQGWRGRLALGAGQGWAIMLAAAAGCTAGRWRTAGGRHYAARRNGAVGLASGKRRRNTETGARCANSYAGRRAGAHGARPQIGRWRLAGWHSSGRLTATGQLRRAASSASVMTNAGNKRNGVSYGYRRRAIRRRWRTGGNATASGWVNVS